MEFAVSALFVPEIVIANPERNRKALESTIRSCYETNKDIHIDLAVGPELSICEYQLSEEAEHFEKIRGFAERIPEGETSQLLMKLSKEYETHLVAGIPEIDKNGVYYNSAVITGPKGEHIGTCRQGRESWRFHFWATGYADEGQRNVFEIRSKKYGIIICAEILVDEVMSPTSELSDVVLVPASWYIEERLFEDNIKETARDYRVPLVIGNRGLGFYDGTEHRIYKKSLEGKYNEGELVKGRAAIVLPGKEPTIKERNIFFVER